MANTPANSQDYTYSSSAYWIAPARNFRTSARLHLQHALCQNTLGCLLEPRVQHFVESSRCQTIESRRPWLWKRRLAL
ncbi:hypothetical protein F4809DRAFT_596459 [Biscogniauxia mediterranea]|nr:hypothetical protein F4809DRAFT_596459 [Biscogniauxia mediterranea]